MWLRTSCELGFEVTDSATFILMLRPRSGPQQWVAQEAYSLEPFVPVVEFTDSFGNLCQRLVVFPGEFSVRTTAEVMTDDHADRAFGAPFTAVHDLSHGLLRFLLPSRYCESDRFGQMATQITAGFLPGYNQVAAIENWLPNDLSLRAGNQRGAAFGH